ncbi:MAG: DUF2064 domain-containing protein, partial [Chitinivibrionales bacterium]|nr:DUF2064 domain-containing protein [Chitinivibrionales bacterium]
GLIPGGLEAFFSKAAMYFPQREDNLGDRMKNACLHCHDLGFARYIVIGCDCPERTGDDILQASLALRQGCNVVLGPVRDGGYHLAGVDMRGLEIFKATAWGAAALMQETVAIVHKRRLKFSLLQMRNDIDTVKDYRRWKSRQGTMTPRRRCRRNNGRPPPLRGG